jgi:large subunit ribosomal protein L31
MKTDIQPKVYTDCVVTCACGNSFTTTSTQQKITVDICSACHPFYTGKQKFIDTEGRIEKFEKKVKMAQESQAKAANRRSSRSSKAKTANKSTETKRKTLKEMLEEAQKSE